MKCYNSDISKALTNNNSSAEIQSSRLPYESLIFNHRSRPVFADEQKSASSKKLAHIQTTQTVLR